MQGNSFSDSNLKYNILKLEMALNKTNLENNLFKSMTVMTKDMNKKNSSGIGKSYF